MHIAWSLYRLAIPSLAVFFTKTAITSKMAKWRGPYNYWSESVYSSYFYLQHWAYPNYDGIISGDALCFLREKAHWSMPHARLYSNRFLSRIITFIEYFGSIEIIAYRLDVSPNEARFTIRTHFWHFSMIRHHHKGYSPWPPHFNVVSCFLDGRREYGNRARLSYSMAARYALRQ